MLGLELMPPVEIDHRRIGRILLGIETQNPWVDIEAEKLKVFCIEEGFDFGQGMLVFLNVKQQVAALAH